MNCPVCGKEMEQGTCRFYHGRAGDRRLAWVPLDFKGIMTKGRIEQSGGVVTTVHSTIFDNDEQISWCCKECGKLVIDIKK